MIQQCMLSPSHLDNWENDDQLMRSEIVECLVTVAQYVLGSIVE